MEIRIFYFCDGKKEGCCGKRGCYKNGGGCKHTSDMEHAANFYKKLQITGHTTFYEKGPASEDQVQV